MLSSLFFTASHSTFQLSDIINLFPYTEAETFFFPFPPSKPKMSLAELKTEELSIWDGKDSSSHLHPFCTSLMLDQPPDQKAPRGSNTEE